MADDVGLNTSIEFNKYNSSLNSQDFNQEDDRCTWFEDNSKCEIILAVKRFVSVISIISCLLVILMIWLFRKYICLTQRLILYLAIAALLNTMMFLVGDLPINEGACKFLGWGLTYTSWQVLAWICCITFNLYMVAVKMKRVDKWEWIYHMLCWGGTFIIASLPFIQDKFGPAGPWCWIKPDFGWRFGIFYIPKLIIWTLLLAGYIHITVVVTTKVRRWEGTYNPDVERQKVLLKEDIKPLRLYPIIYLLLSIFPLANRTQNAIDPGHPVFALVLLHAICSPMQGAVNAVVFGMDKDTRHRLSWTQIKLAFLSHRHSSKSIIREFSVESVDQFDSNQQNVDETQTRF